MASVLETAGRGVLRLGMRLYAFQVSGEDLVLHSLATARSRLIAIEGHIGRPLRGLRAPISSLPLASEVVRARRIIHRDDLDLFHSFMREATNFDPASLDASPETAGINNGVLAPIFVRDEPWGLLGVVSPTLTGNDADAVSLFATHVGSALEVAESIETLEKTNRELSTCYAELARAQAELIERERLGALGELAAVVAHEMRDPLCVLFNSIGGLRDFVSSGAPPEKLADATAFAAMADEEAARLNQIVSDLLGFAHPHPPALRVGSLLPVLEAVASATAPDGRVRIEIDGELPPVELDALFLQQALLNLVLNGLQAIAKDGTVTVRASTTTVGSDTFVCVDVSDDGPGIPADVRASIFEPFFTTKPSGTGLGLAVVKRVVDAHGGRLAVESGKRGTRFGVMLPAVGK
ncbi:MAG: multi-sensor signal transduction histidine kinase [Labilithrix sp.]|nr:multi-sensor signal transduction histidine kinase [Labilithrix sp.]